MQLQSVDSKLADEIKEVLGEVIDEMTAYRGDLTIFIPKEEINQVALILRDDKELKFDQMMDLTAVDYLNYDYNYRFEVVYHFFSLELGHRLRVKVKIPENDALVPSISDLWLCANWYERECYDMYGISFSGHPDLTRIIMYDGFEGHPLRKDYPIHREQPLLELKDIPERYNYRKPDLPSYE
ncbi:MAG: NADH-quinone oxidoreductase subunit C [SAR324 cluster bacterium]|nr:NADH-quinone oxidoreductase subunit C [SAR324 cluster bacterium]